MSYDNHNQIALWKNEDKREGKKDPDYRGQGEVDGKLYWADCWINASKKDGKKFLSIKLKEKEARSDAPRSSTKQTAAQSEKFDDDIPF